MRRLLFGFAALLVMTAVAQAQTSVSVGPEKCAELKSLQVPGVALTISNALWFPAGPAPAQGPAPAAAPPVQLPAYCRLDGMIDRRQGVGGQYGIGFALSLPGTWNGRFLMQGGGGLNGRVGLPLGAQAAGGSPALTRGFAVVSTDTGHQSTTAFDGSFMQDQQAALDFAFVAIGRVAALAKEIVARHYGKPADHSYFVGCSTGGREAMLMSQRYPTYFDGIVAGAPAMRTGHSNLSLRSSVVAFNNIAPRDPSGKPITAQAFSESDRKTIIDGIVNACDANDGVKDGMIFDQRSCKFDPATLVCKGAKADGCLSSAQAAALSKSFAGPKDSKGNPVYTGYYYDTGIAAMGGGIPGILLGAGPPVGAPAALAQDVDKEEREVETTAQGVIADTWSWTNLNTFSGHGGKLLFYHGVSDPWFSAQDTVGYYERLGKANGGADVVKNWSRLFLSPGMGHCQGGAAALDTFDLLTALVDWVEKGTPPDAVTATGRAFPGRSRPLCAYPQHAHYKGSGDPQDARNFECRN
jgi:feruloyl esterase